MNDDDKEEFTWSEFMEDYWKRKDKESRNMFIGVFTGMGLFTLWASVRIIYTSSL